VKKETKVIISAETSKYERGMRDMQRVSRKATRVVALQFAALTAATGGFAMLIAKGFKDAFSSVEDYRMSTASLASTITSFSKNASKDLSGIYKQAYEYSEQLVLKMEEWNAKTVATGKNLTAMAETLAQNGILLDLNNKKQEKGFLAIANALALMTQGQNQDIQFRQEIRGLAKGEIKATNLLAKLLSERIGGELKKHVELWKKEGTLIENAGALLDGFQEGAKDLQNTWQAVGTTLATIYNRILRGVFEKKYESIIETGKKISLFVMNNEQEIKQAILTIIDSFKLLGKIALATIPLIIIQFNMLTGAIGLSQKALLTFRMSFLTVNAQAAIFSGTLIALKASALVLFAAFVGWEIGKYLYDNFESARLAGLAMIDGLIKSWIHFKYFFKSSGNVLKNIWWGSIKYMRDKWTDFLEMIANGAKHIPILKQISEPLLASVEILRKGTAAGFNYAEQSKKIAESKKAELKTHEAIIESIRKESVAYQEVKSPKQIVKAPEQIKKKIENKEEQNYNKMMEGIRQKYYDQIFDEIKAAEEKKLEIKKSFNEQYAELGKSIFDIERDKLNRQIELWEGAGVKQTQIAQLTSAKLKQITLAEQQAKLAIYSNIAGQIAGTFMQIAQAGGKQSKKAFIMYKAFAIAQAGIQATMAILNTLASPLLPAPTNVIMASVIGAMAAAQIAMIASAQPPSYDQGGISNAKGVYQTGNIAEAHIPIPSGGKIPVQVNQQKQPMQIILNNPTFQDIETQQQVMAQIAEFVTERVAPGAVVENYNNDGIVRQMTKSGY